MLYEVITFSGIVIEAHYPCAGSKIRQLLRNRGQRRPTRYADQNALFAGDAARHLLGVFGLDLDRAIDRLGVEIGRNEACTDALDRVRGGLTTRDDRRQRRFDSYNFV